MNETQPAVIFAFGHILHLVGASGNLYPAPDLIKPQEYGTPYPEAVMEALQIMTDRGLAERYLQDDTVMVRLTPAGVALAKEAKRVHAERKAQRER